MQLITNGQASVKPERSQPFGLDLTSLQEGTQYKNAFKKNSYEFFMIDFQAASLSHNHSSLPRDNISIWCKSYYEGSFFYQCPHFFHQFHGVNVLS